MDYSRKSSRRVLLPGDKNKRSSLRLGDISEKYSVRDRKTKSQTDKDLEE